MRYAVLSLGLVGCLGPYTDTGSSELSGNVTGWTESCGGTSWSGQATLTGSSNGIGRLNLFSGGVVEEHQLSGAPVTTTTGGSGAGPESTLSVTLSLATTTSGYGSRDGSTLFPCDDDGLNGGDMTYALRTYDADGVLSDCVAWGDDASLVGFGGATTNGALPTLPDELTGCRTATF